MARIGLLEAAAMRSIFMKEKAYHPPFYRGGPAPEGGCFRACWVVD